MAYVINGGEKPTIRFQLFVDLCCQAYNLIRKRANLFLNLLSLVRLLYCYVVVELQFFNFCPWVLIRLHWSKRPCLCFGINYVWFQTEMRMYAIMVAAAACGAAKGHPHNLSWCLLIGCGFPITCSLPFLRCNRLPYTHGLQVCTVRECG